MDEQQEIEEGSSNIVVSSGTLITTDIPTKQLIVLLNQENQNKFIIQDLDDTHLLINSKFVQFITEECERLHELNVFERKQ